MKHDPEFGDRIAQAFKDGWPIDEAVRAGVREVLARHRMLGQSVVIMRDGKIVRLSPADIAQIEAQQQQQQQP